MTLRVAINGFGRIGRNVLRALSESGRRDIEVVAINDLGPVETNAHLLEFDSVHGRFAGRITTTENTIDAGRGPMRVTALRDPEALPWGDVDVVLECTGIFTDRNAAARHLKNGARRVLVSAPSKGADRTVVYGVNHSDLTAGDVIVSNASCTTNCLAPLAKVLHETVGITRGFMTTIHSYTGDQPTLDTMHKDLYRARAAGLNIIPTTTGAARAVGLVLPELAGRLDGTAIRVPTPNVSVVDLTFEAARDTSVDEINTAVALATTGPLAGVLDVTHRELVSSDFNHNPHSSIFASDQTRVMEGRLCRVLSWYDNEWGFSNRMLDVAAEMGRHLQHRGGPDTRQAKVMEHT
ncbi:type I glyceraldehyde-3-phosphate dehydrogenase [Roseovarius sp.]|uniref:type I glyceraldehyde-3-phosphate dehydrogenase n=1 Tax=Roseovarius sp. TaxID=1486281 RepID=UPI003A96E58B